MGRETGSLKALERICAEEVECWQSFGVKPMPLIHVNRFSLKHRRQSNRYAFWGILVAVVYICGLAGCFDVNNVSDPPAGPGPVTIVTTSPLPSGTENQPYAAA